MISTASDCCLWLDEVYFAPIWPSQLIDGLQLIYVSSQQRSTKSAPAEFKSEVWKKKKEKPSLHGPIIPTPSLSYLLNTVLWLLLFLLFLCLFALAYFFSITERLSDINGNFTSDRGYRFQTRSALLAQKLKAGLCQLAALVSETKGTCFKSEQHF